MSTEGLMFPTDPLAAMRDLQELDAPKPTPAKTPVKATKTIPDKTADKTAPAGKSAGQPVTQQSGNTVSQSLGQIVSKSDGHMPDDMTSHTSERNNSTGNYTKPSAELKKQMRAMKEGDRKTKTFKITPALERWMKKHIADRWDNPPEHQEILERGLLLYMLEQETGQDLLELDKE